MNLKEIRCVLYSTGSGDISMDGSCEYDNEHLGFIKGGEFLDQLNDCQLPKRGSVPCS
jgi:hypothetical protein